MSENQKYIFVLILSSFVEWTENTSGAAKSIRTKMKLQSSDVICVTKIQSSPEGWGFIFSRSDFTTVEFNFDCDFARELFTS